MNDNQLKCTHLRDMRALLDWLFDHLLSRDSTPYGIIFMNVYVIITVKTAMLFQILSLTGYQGICVFSTLYFPIILDGQFTSTS
jgi:hypothetical protein